jgi:D-alanine--poly(phosphoribitol) ligase subunit 1
MAASMNYNLAQPFFDSARKFPEKFALYADGENYSYRQILDHVLRTASWLSSDSNLTKRVGILGSRSMEACVGILAAAWVGAAYVPISLKHPDQSVAGLLERSGVVALIADRTGSRMLTGRVLEHAPKRILAVRGFAPVGSDSCVQYFDSLPPTSHLNQPVLVGSDALAYILYTSGTTGIPKGAMLSCGAVKHLLDVMEANYPLSHEDRVAETTETSFDLSVYNMFSAWRASASLHIIPPSRALGAAKFVQEHQITRWLSVPSIAAFMNRMGL